jgi:hypothetical protein
MEARYNADKMLRLKSVGFASVDADADNGNAKADAAPPTLTSVFEGVIPPPNKCASPASVSRPSRRNVFRCSFESCDQRFREEYQLW